MNGEKYFQNQSHLKLGGYCGIVDIIFTAIKPISPTITNAAMTIFLYFLYGLILTQLDCSIDQSASGSGYFMRMTVVHFLFIQVCEFLAEPDDIVYYTRLHFRL